MFNSQAPADQKTVVVGGLYKQLCSVSSHCAVHHMSRFCYSGLAYHQVPTCRDPSHVCVGRLEHCMLAVQAPQEAGLLHLVLQFQLQGLSSFSSLAEQPGKGRACKCLVAACIRTYPDHFPALCYHLLPKLPAEGQSEQSVGPVEAHIAHLESRNFPKAASGRARLLSLGFKPGQL